MSFDVPLVAKDQPAAVESAREVIVGWALLRCTPGYQARIDQLARLIAEAAFRRYRQEGWPPRRG